MPRLEANQRKTGGPVIAAGNRGLELSTFDEMWRFATAVSASGICPKSMRTPEQILVALQFGAELGLKPMQCLSTVMVVNGRATLWGDGMLAVAQSSGLLEDIAETMLGDVSKPETLVARCEVKRKDRKSPVIVEFSWKDAKQAKLADKDLYKAYPKRMLKARARAYALRDCFPDVLTGIVTDVEAEEMVDLPEAPPTNRAVQRSEITDLLAQQTPVQEVVEEEPEVEYNIPPEHQVVDDGAPSDADLARDGVSGELFDKGNEDPF